MALHVDGRESTSTIPHRAVVVSFDRFHSGFIGCCGNDWIETPNFDRLASEAVFFDQHFCDNLDPGAANHAWWTGRHQFSVDTASQRACPAFIDALSARGVKSCLIVESDGNDDSTVAPPFDEVHTVHGRDGFDVPESETPFAQVVTRSVDWLGESAKRTGPELLWIKSRGIPVPWSAPQDFADLYLAEFGLTEENDSPEDAGENDAEHDLAARGAFAEQGAPPEDDQSMEWRYAAAMYAGYVTLVDRWLGRLLQAVHDSPRWKDALLVVTTAAGQTLGEHGPLEDDTVRLRSELAQTPLWVRVPGSDQSCTRRQALVQTIDLAPTLLDWFGFAPTDQTPDAAPIESLDGRSLLPLICHQPVAPRDSLVMGNGRLEWGIRTFDFFYVEPGDAQRDLDSSPCRLFEKPADRWDQSDVLSQFPQIADELQASLRRQIEASTVQTGNPT
jgi:arylsulfatase A-like enzyme